MNASKSPPASVAGGLLLVEISLVVYIRPSQSAGMEVP
jgi:hypothetical protein